jgi:SAM-dependent methyltransferase
VNNGGIRGAVAFCHHFLRERVKHGDLVVDATCGNGQDTLLLAELVGSSGRVWGFDIQEAALQRTCARVADAGFSARVTLVHAGHERLADYIDAPVQAAVFNLGYLPSGNQEIATRGATTAAALAQAAALLSSGGVILIAVYTGHDGGMEEWQAVREWGAALPPRQFNVWQSRQLNRPDTAPFMVLVEKI